MEVWFLQIGNILLKVLFGLETSNKSPWKFKKTKFLKKVTSGKTENGELA